MNATQENYVNAKALFETAVTSKFAALAPYSGLMYTERHAEWVELEEKFNTQFDCDVYRSLMRLCANEMIDWSVAKVLKNKHCTAKSRAAIASMVANRNTPEVYAKLVDLAFRLE